MWMIHGVMATGILLRILVYKDDWFLRKLYLFVAMLLL